MTVRFDYPPGATPLDGDELASLIPGHITTQGELNEWEQLNIAQGENRARKQRKKILTEGFLRQLHKQMFGATWKWAGEFRKSDKNIGVDWLKIGVELRNLLDDTRFQIEHASYPPDEIAIRFHHRLVAIHPLSKRQRASCPAHGRSARRTSETPSLHLGQMESDRRQRHSTGIHRGVASRRPARHRTPARLCPELSPRGAEATACAPSCSRQGRGRGPRIGSAHRVDQSFAGISPRSSTSW